jgi:PAS domain S-box-containing protein
VRAEGKNPADMTRYSEGATDEVRRLQDCLNDLVSMMALPALWMGREPPDIVGALLDGLVRMLRLDFAQARISDCFGGAPLEILRPQGAALADSRGLSTATFPLGVTDSLGVIVLGSARRGFPSEIERLLIRVGANQAAIGLQEARRRNDQRRAARELEQRVAERTEELTRVNAALRSEIAERRRAEEERLMLASLVENSADFIGIASLAGEMLFLNAAGQDLAGMTGEDEARAASAFDFVVEEDRERVRADVWPVVLRDGGWDGELRFTNPRTRLSFPMHTHAFVIKDAQGGGPVAVATISRDITQRKRDEAELLRAREELAHVSRVTTMGELTATIAHEVNQPLAALVANANACIHWLAAEPSNFDEVHAAAKRIIRDANRASEVMTRIRTFLTRAKPHHAPVEVGEAICDVVDIVQGEARAKRVTLIAAAGSDLPPVMGDRVQLEQVLINLAMNGIEAMGAVSERERFLEIGACLDPADEVRVYVSDTGPGLDEAQRERVFDAFYTTKPHGMGMGLAISRSIVESHGGRLWAQRNRAAGETFQFTLPTRQWA